MSEQFSLGQHDCCDFCGGTGKMECQKCTGWGYSVGFDYNPRNYGEPVQIQCSECGGSGVSECWECGGSGACNCVECIQNYTNS